MRLISEILEPIPSFAQPLQKASCGLFGVTEDFSEDFQSLDERFIKNKAATYFFEATGSSMNPLIRPGEILVVDRSIKNVSGRVCVVALDGELVCKWVYIRGNQMILKSEDPRHKDIIIHIEESHSAIVFGVVTARCGEIK